jgi:hypothetical protein
MAAAQTNTEVVTSTENGLIGDFAEFAIASFPLIARVSSLERM